VTSPTNEGKIKLLNDGEDKVICYNA